MIEINKVIAAVRELDREAMDACRFRLDNLVKPVGSLGSLEDIAVKIAGVTGNPRPWHLKKSLIILAADHGIVAQKTGGYSQKVSSGAYMMLNIARGFAPVNFFAKYVGADVVLADIGLAQDLSKMPAILNVKIAGRTKNIMSGAAMTKDEALRAIKTGIRLAENEISRGVRLIGLGETGIGNTTVAAAIVAACGGFPASAVVGGGGVSEEIISGETMIIERALAVNKPDSQDALDVLSKLGGFEIAGLVGVILGAAKGGAAVVIDGAATSAAALLAVKMAPLAKDFLIGSLKTDEPCHQKALEMLDLRAYLDLDMRVGQGCGAVLGMSLVKAALHILNDMKTFAETGVSVAQDGVGKSRQKNYV